MGRLKRKRPASPKKKGHRKVTKENRPQADLKDQAVTSVALKTRPEPDEVVVAKREAPKPIKPSGPKMQLAFLTKATQFLREVKIELKKVTWPSRKETVASTAVVIILVMIVSSFLGLVDVGLSSLIRLLLH